MNLLLTDHNCPEIGLSNELVVDCYFYTDFYTGVWNFWSSVVSG